LAQGGPPYYTNDPGTPGNKKWEINLGYMPFLDNDQSMTHTPDVDINFGLGDRIQLTYENAWSRVYNTAENPKYGLGQDQLGRKWRFYDNRQSGFALSVFPQLSLNNPNNSANRGITPPGASLFLPAEFSKKLGPVNLNWEVGYNFVHLALDGYVAGVVVTYRKISITSANCITTPVPFSRAFGRQQPQSTWVEGASIVMKSSDFERFERPVFWVLLFHRGNSAASAARHIAILKMIVRFSVMLFVDPAFLSLCSFAFVW
jgi:hypothetical protein